MLAFSFYFSRLGHHPDLRAFPTRRSSDLNYYKPGPATRNTTRIYSIDKKREVNEPIYDIWGKFYIDGNYVEGRSEEHTSELQSRENLVCRLLLEKKKIIPN